MPEANSQQAAPEQARPKSLGKTLATVGVAMFCISIIVAMFLGIGGALFHNIMQLGGLALAIVGVVMWKVMKK